jgi:hypothetical protein
MKPPNVEGLGLRILEAEQQPAAVWNPRQSSIELQMSSKGERYFQLKVYLDHTDPDDVEAAMAWLRDTNARLRREYRI